MTTVGQKDEGKGVLAHLLNGLASAPAGGALSVLAASCHEDATFDVFHPFNRLEGVASAAEHFWEPLRASFPDYEHRLAFAVEGEYEGRQWVSTLGQVMGTFSEPWVGIPPTHGLTILRVGINALVEDGRIAKMYVLLDIVDVMRQAGYYPFRGMPGSAEQWPFPPASSGASLWTPDPEQGAATLRTVLQMQDGLGSGATLEDHAATAEHSPHWHQDMGWYGPAGIGSTRGQRGFDDFHGAPFIGSFPDRGGFERTPGGPMEAPGHYIQAGDGQFAVTGGWPSLHGTHTGAGWLGLPPTGRKVEMRVADWYRLDDTMKIVDNWVLIDIPHIVKQMGHDLLDEMRYQVDPTIPRWEAGS